LIDPYAKAIAGDVIYGQEIFNYSLEDSRNDPSPSLFYLGLDDAHLIPKAIVIDDTFDWGGDRLLQIPWSETIIYETHVKGFTKLHPDIPENLRGTYAGLAHPVAIAYLKSLGITAVELLPVHHIFPCPQFLAKQGLCDYWGYRTLGYFTPYSGYSASGILGQQVTEFKQMVKSLHAAGIEVILDVVYNHTGEGNPSEPTLSWRGIDNAVYYRLNEDNKSEYLDFTGCGNSLNVSHPQVLKMILDSLRYWVTEMHIDGFRFDEAPTLARECFSTDYQIQLTISQDNNQSESETFCEKITKIQYDMGAAFFDIIHQDPVLSQVKLIAEACDAGDGGYQVGNFPILWLQFTRQLLQFRRQYLVFRQRNWLEQSSRRGSIDWFNPDGSEISEEQWQDGVCAISIFLNGEGNSRSDDRDDSFFLFFNAEDEKIEFALPTELQDREWKVVIDTTEPHFIEENRFYQENQNVPVEARSLVVLQGKKI
jgi:isoamylase